MDAKEIHGLSCKYSAKRHRRHAALNDVIRRALKSAGIPSILESTDIDKRDGKKPDSISYFFEETLSLLEFHLRGYSTLRHTLIVQL